MTFGHAAVVIAANGQQYRTVSCVDRIQQQFDKQFEVGFGFMFWVDSRPAVWTFLNGCVEIQ